MAFSNVIVYEKTIESPCDLIKRNAHNFIFKICDFQSDIKICTLDCPPVNAKSLLGILNLQIHKNDLIRIICFNEDKEQAIADTQKTISILQTLGCDVT